MPKKQYSVIYVEDRLAARVAGYLRANRRSALQPERDTIVVTACFPDGRQADVKCCGSRTGPSWAEMVLFGPDGSELCCTEPRDEFTGEWRLDYEGDTYVVYVIPEYEKARRAVVTDGERHAMVLYQDPVLSHHNIRDRLADAAMEWVGDPEHFTGGLTFRGLLHCPDEIFDAYGFRMTEIDANDPLMRQFVHIELAPEGSLISEDDFLDP